VVCFGVGVLCWVIGWLNGGDGGVGLLCCVGGLWHMNTVMGLGMGLVLGVLVFVESSRCLVWVVRWRFGSEFYWRKVARGRFYKLIVWWFVLVWVWWRSFFIARLDCFTAGGVVVFCVFRNVFGLFGGYLKIRFVELARFVVVLYSFGFIDFFLLSFFK